MSFISLFIVIVYRAARLSPSCSFCALHHKLLSSEINGFYLEISRSFLFHLIGNIHKTLRHTLLQKKRHRLECIHRCFFKVEKRLNGRSKLLPTIPYTALDLIPQTKFWTWITQYGGYNKKTKQNGDHQILWLFSYNINLLNLKIRFKKNLTSHHRRYLAKTHLSKLFWDILLIKISKIIKVKLLKHVILNGRWNKNDQFLILQKTMTDHIFIYLRWPSVVQKVPIMVLVQTSGKNTKLLTSLYNKFMILNILRFIKILTFINKQGDLAQLSQKMAGEIFFKCDI